MAYTISQFANNSSPNLANLDQNFNALGLLTPIPCAVAGTNTLALTQNSASQAASITVAAYANGLQICGVAAQTNTSAVTAALGSLAALNVYKDSVAGPIALVSGEIVQNNAFTLVYDSTLNSSAGGWHLVSGTSAAGSTITPALVRASIGLQIGATTTPTLSGLLQATATLVYTAIVPGQTQDQSFTVAGLLSSDGLAMALPLPSTTGLTFSTYFAAGSTIAGTVTVRCANVTPGGTLTPGTITVGMKAFRTV